MNFGFEDVLTDKNYYRDQWKNMPEFIQDKQEIFKELIIKFPKKEDFEDFQKQLNRTISIKNKSIWYPGIPIESRNCNLGWVDSNETE